MVVNLYPFGTAADNPATPFDALVEEIDIGGPSLLRAAAKNFRDVLVVVHPEDYPKVLEELARAGGPSLEFRFELMKKAFMHTGQYDGMIAMTMAHVDVDGGAMTRKPLKRPTQAVHGGPRTCATARTRIRAPPGSSSRRTPGGALGGPPGQGALVHEPARPRCRAAHRARVQRAGGSGDQAHQPVRRRHGRTAG